MLRPMPRMPSRLNRTEMSIRDKVWQINWSLIAVLTAIAGIGFATCIRRRKVRLSRGR